MNHILVDLETMGCGSKAAIVALGAVVFDPYADVLGTDFYYTVRLESSLKLGLEVDASTIMWWMNQSDDARSALKNFPCEINNVLFNFAGFMKTHHIERFWCHGATFDAVILANEYQLWDGEPPFSHRDVRCTRTLFELAGMTKTVVGGVEHHALDDAKRHAADVQTAYKLLGLKP